MKLGAIPGMLSLIPAALAGMASRDLERIKTMIREAYPSVPRVGTGTLAAWMAESKPSLFVVDVRAPEEFAVSHLRGAENLRTVERIEAGMARHGAATTVLYCAVGFRSSRLARALFERGARDVLSLEGSIFQWANEGRAIYRGDVPARKVHPHGRRWAGLLEDGLASEC